MAMQDLGLHRMVFRFDRKGASVLLNSGDVEVAEHDYPDMLRPRPAAPWPAGRPAESNGWHPAPIEPLHR